MIYLIKKQKHQIFGLLWCALLLTACESNHKKANQEVPSIQKDEDYLITIKTDRGEMKAILFDQTPKHKANFIKLAYQGFYDQTLFHRVIKDFMIQGGDPESKSAGAKNLGDGGPGYTVPAEFHPDLHHVRGAIAAARQGDQVNPTKASNGSQFYITHGKTYSRAELDQYGTNIQKLQNYFFQLMEKEGFGELKLTFMNLQNEQDQAGFQRLLFSQKDTIEKIFNVNLSERVWTKKELNDYTQIGGVPLLDQKYTVFGQILTGMNTVDKIVMEQTNQEDRPLNDIKMNISVEVVKKSFITKNYGYNY